MKNDYIWKRISVHDLDPKGLTDCLQYCWDAIPKRIQKIMRKKLIRLALLACKIKYKKNDKILNDARTFEEMLKEK